MRNRVVRLLLKKEILDVLRDRKAVIMLVLVPLLIYPLIFFGAFAVMSLVQSNMEDSEYTVLLEAEDGGALESKINEYNRNKMQESTSTDAQAQLQLRSVAELSEDIEGADGMSHEEIIDSLLQQEKLDVYITSTVDADGMTVYETKYVSSITDSSYAEDLVKEVLDSLQEDETAELIEEAGLDAEEITHPFDVKRTNIASTEQSAGSLMGMILPFMLIVSLLMGTMYPAIDTTAGEKERGTLETLLTLPIRNHEMIFAKFLTVALMGIVSALLNVISMGLMLFYVLRLMQSSTLGGLGLDMSGFRFSTFIPAIIVTSLAIMAFSLFISAVTMCITALARSYKEANNYVTPLTLVVMLTGYIGFIPNIELTPRMAMVPVANICLLVKEMLLFKIDMGIIAIVLISNIVYAGLAILLLSRMYDSEAVLFDEGRFGLQLFEKRANIKAGGVPTSGDAWFIVLFVLIVYLYGGSMLQLKYGLTGVLLSQLIILLIPLAMALYTKRSIARTYSFRRFGVVTFVGALLFFIGVFLAVNIITTLMYNLFPSQFESTNTVLESMLRGDNMLITVLVVALAPAVCEEMMFRGFMFSGFRSKYRLVPSIILVAVIFGAYHTSIVRFLPTALLGAALAIILYYTGSIIPGMIMHFLNNLVSVIAMFYPDTLERLFPMIFSSDMGVMPSLILGVVSIVMIYGGTKIMRISRR